jgi:hypothetical protein
MSLAQLYPNQLRIVYYNETDLGAADGAAMKQGLIGEE